MDISKQQEAQQRSMSNADETSLEKDPDNKILKKNHPNPIK